MLDIKYILENKEKVTKLLGRRNVAYDIDLACSYELKRRGIIAEVEQLKAVRNTTSDQIAILKRSKQNADKLIADMQEQNLRIKELDALLAETEVALKNLLLSIPNIPNEDLPYGKSDADNKVMRICGQLPKFDFAPLPHWELGEKLKLFDWQRAGKISGSRFTVCMGLAARLERALYNFMLDTHIANGYWEVFPPYIVNRTSMTATGQLPKFEEDAFALKDTDYFLVPTAEVPITNLHRDEILPITALPISYTAYTACFRAEAGSAGRDTRGLIRQHQFNKVELVKFSHPDKSYEQLEILTADAERILQLLDLPYRVSLLCSGDVGFASAKTYDLEVYMPSYNNYVEISSCSNYEDYQARRANIKFRDENGKNRLVHTLNGSGLAVGRTVAAIIENFQNQDGSITVPKVLVKYMGCETIK